jgi:DNA-binding NtrC family response regulator
MKVAFEKRGLDRVLHIHHGTLFLDEIGDVPLAMQVKLLRLIESGAFRRVGGLETLHADFRLVAATYKPLKTMIADGRFRPDLYYRISAFPIHLPALRERVGDIPLLVNSFLQRSVGGKGRISVDSMAMKQLPVHPWPGSIRELRNALERALLFSDDGVIRAEHLPPDVHPASANGVMAQALAGFSGTRRELASQLGISERTLYRRLKALRLD